MGEDEPVPPLFTEVTKFWRARKFRDSASFVKGGLYKNPQNGYFGGSFLGRTFHGAEKTREFERSLEYLLDDLHTCALTNDRPGGSDLQLSFPNRTRQSGYVIEAKIKERTRGRRSRSMFDLELEEAELERALEDVEESVRELNERRKSHVDLRSIPEIQNNNSDLASSVDDEISDVCRTETRTFANNSNNSNTSDKHNNKHEFRQRHEWNEMLDNNIINCDNKIDAGYNDQGSINGSSIGSYKVRSSKLRTSKQSELSNGLALQRENHQVSRTRTKVSDAIETDCANKLSLTKASGGERPSGERATISTKVKRGNDDSSFCRPKIPLCLACKDQVARDGSCDCRGKIASAETNPKRTSINETSTVCALEVRKKNKKKASRLSGASPPCVHPADEVRVHACNGVPSVSEVGYHADIDDSPPVIVSKPVKLLRSDTKDELPHPSAFRPVKFLDGDSKYKLYSQSTRSLAAPVAVRDTCTQTAGARSCDMCTQTDDVTRSFRSRVHHMSASFPEFQIISVEKARPLRSFSLLPNQKRSSYIGKRNEQNFLRKF